MGPQKACECTTNRASAVGRSSSQVGPPWAAISRAERFVPFSGPTHMSTARQLERRDDDLGNGLAVSLMQDAVELLLRKARTDIARGEDSGANT